MSNSDDTSRAPEGSSASAVPVVDGALAVASTPAPEAKAAAEPPKEEPRYPTIVFAIEKGFPQAQVEKQFRDEGMTLIFAKTEEDVVQHIKNPECYVVFVGIEFAKNGILLMRKYLPQTQAYWVMITGHLSTQKRSALLNAGAVDLLVHPVGAAQYKLRAKGLLGRYLKAYDMPKEIILPPGFNRKEEAAARGEASGNNANAQQGYNHRAGDGSSHAQQQQGYGHRSGDASDRPEVRFHDLSREKDGPGYTHHSSSDDPSSPEWRNKISADQEGPAWRNKISGDDSTNPDWRQHASEKGHEDSQTKRISPTGADESPSWRTSKSGPDGTAPDWRQHATGPDGKPVPRNSSASSPNEQPDWRNSNSSNPNAVRGASSVVQISNPNDKNKFNIGEQDSRNPALWRNNASKTENVSPFRQRLEGETDEQFAARMAATQPQFRSGDMPSDKANSADGESARTASIAATATATPTRPKIPVPEGPIANIREPLTLIEAIRQKMVHLGTNRPWDPKIWTNVEPLTSSHFEGMDRSIVNLSRLFRDACKTLGAKRITLVSYRPALLLESYPDEVIALVSSDADPRHNEQVTSLLFPHLRVAYEEGAPFLLNESLPTEIEGKRRPETWCIDGKNEKMAALLPVLSDRKVAMSLFIQFDRNASPEVHSLLEQAVTYFREPEKHYNLLDFISRVYRESPK